MVAGLYDLLEGLILARYDSSKLAQLQATNGKLDVLRHQTRLLLDFELMSHRRYQHASKLLYDIGNDLGGWRKQQQPISKPKLKQHSHA